MKTTLVVNKKYQHTCQTCQTPCPAYVFCLTRPRPHMPHVSATCPRFLRPLAPPFQSPRGFLKGEPQFPLERRGSAVSPALSRLAFPWDMSPRVCRTCPAQTKKLHACVLCVLCVLSLEPPGFFARHIPEGMCLMCLTCHERRVQSKITQYVRHVQDVRKTLCCLDFSASHMCKATCDTRDTHAACSQFATSCEMTVPGNENSLTGNNGP